MVKRLMADGSRRLNEMMDDPDSMLYKLIHTSKNNAEMERIIERNYIALIAVAILEILAYLFCVWNLYGGILILCCFWHSGHVECLYFLQTMKNIIFGK